MSNNETSITDTDGVELRGIKWCDGMLTLGVTDNNATPPQEAVILLHPDQIKKLRKFLKNKKSLSGKGDGADA